MKVKVRLLRKNGRPVLKPDADEPPRVGELLIKDWRDPVSERPVTRAQLLDANDGLATDVLPELLDARIVWAKANQWRLTGFERIDNADYLQTWQVEVAC